MFRYYSGVLSGHLNGKNYLKLLKRAREHRYSRYPCGYEGFRPRGNKGYFIIDVYDLVNRQSKLSTSTVVLNCDCRGDTCHAGALELYTADMKRVGQTLGVNSLDPNSRIDWDLGIDGLQTNRRGVLRCMIARNEAKNVHP